MYGLECCAIDKTMKRKMNVMEMRMLRWMIRVTIKDRIRNEYIRGSVGVVPIVDKLHENRLKWLRHV